MLKFESKETLSSSRWYENNFENLFMSMDNRRIHRMTKNNFIKHLDLLVLYIY